MKYYTLDEIESKDCDYNFIFSGRGPGKSTAMVNKLIDAFCDGGEEFVRIARYDWETSRVLMASWFNEVNRRHLEEKLGSGYTVKFNKGQWLLCDEEDNYNVIGHLVTLNNQDTFKSASFDRVTNIVYEEFAMLREQDYMVGEVDAFLSACSTIVRRRQNVKCWFIGNTLSKHNPFFEFFGIDIDRLGIKPGDCRAFRSSGFNGHGATVAVQFAKMVESDFMELSPLMRVGGNVTATTGIYDEPESVRDFKKRCFGIPESEFSRLIPSVDGAYMGKGLFCSLSVSKRPRYDDMRLIRLADVPYTYEGVLEKRWLNLSGVFNPIVSIDGYELTERQLKCVNPRTLFADLTEFNKFRLLDRRCVHAFERDEYRFKWQNFVDKWGYEDEYV